MRQIHCRYISVKLYTEGYFPRQLHLLEYGPTTRSHYVSLGDNSRVGSTNALLFLEQKKTPAVTF